jgi:hypothetical protein
VRRILIRYFLPLCFCLLPLLVMVLVVLCMPRDAMLFLRDHLSPMDVLILSIGLPLFTAQLILSWRALRWQGTRFDESGDRWLTNLAQAAEWFPMLGLLGTVGGILQTFSGISGPMPPHRIIQMYAPAITATGAGLFMAFINILPPWMVLLGRDLILTLAGQTAPPPGDSA